MIYIRPSENGRICTTCKWVTWWRVYTGPATPCGESNEAIRVAFNARQVLSGQRYKVQMDGRTSRKHRIQNQLVYIYMAEGNSQQAKRWNPPLRTKCPWRSKHATQVVIINRAVSFHSFSVRLPQETSSCHKCNSCWPMISMLASEVKWIRVVDNRLQIFNLKSLSSLPNTRALAVAPVRACWGTV